MYMNRQLINQLRVAYFMPEKPVFGRCINPNVQTAVCGTWNYVTGFERAAQLSFSPIVPYYSCISHVNYSGTIDTLPLQTAQSNRREYSNTCCLATRRNVAKYQMLCDFSQSFRVGRYFSTNHYLYVVPHRHAYWAKGMRYTLCF